MRSFKRLAFLTTGMTVVLVTIGSIVRVTGSGLGCPDWPKCHGSWIPPLETTALIEYSHRSAASIVGLLALSVALVAWLHHRKDPTVFWPALLALGAVGFQGWLGRQVVLGELPRGLVALHFTTAMVVLGLFALTLGNAWFRRGGGSRSSPAVPALVAAGLVAASLVMGALTAQFPSSVLLHMPVVAITAAAVHLLPRRTRGETGSLRRLSVGLMASFDLQVLIGLGVFAGVGLWTIPLHAFVASVTWVLAVLVSVAAFRARAPEPGLEAQRSRQPAERGAMRIITSYIALTKPRIIELLLISTVPAMVVAAGGWPSWALLAATLTGGILTAGSANAINCYFDRDLDQIMDRTSSRPLPKREVSPGRALTFGVALGLIGGAVLYYFVNLLATAIAVSAIFFYVFVYTVWLKRSTPSNIVIGGAAGAVPVLVGWAAVTGELALAPLVMFAVIFYWTPPHFWALALRHEGDYRAAGIPMLPVVRGSRATTRQMFTYTLMLLAVSIVLYPVAELGAIYLVVAVGSGAYFLAHILRLLRQVTERRAMQVFRGSITYLVVLFSGMALDVLAGSPEPAALAPWALLASVPVFLVAQAGIFMLVASRRRGDATGEVAVEMVWTVIPTVLATGMMLAAWQIVW